MSNTNHGLASDSEAAIVSLATEDAKQLKLTGGKGANLARLVYADLPVPRGFCVTTATYRALVDTPEIQTAIESLDALQPEDADPITERSAEVRSKIRERDLPPEVRQAILEALDSIDAPAYAVRSSATAEDLPTASFAGQHESYLGVEDPDAVLDRIRDCLASLFTERAVTYRLRNGISHPEVAMAVVVQEMADAEVAGVLFTADPVSGNRHVASVDANYGLGDTVVAGDVSPDNARIDRRTGEILEYEVGEKRHALRAGVDGDDRTETIDLSPEKRESRALSDAQLRALVELGEQVEDLLGTPQDVEWALVDDAFVLVQSRPITSLFPLPTPTPDDDRRHIYFSLGHQQAMAEAVPPLVVDWMRELLNNSVAEFRPADAEDSFGVEAGHRVYADVTPLLRYRPLRRVTMRFLDSISKPAAEALEELLDRREQSISSASLLDTVQSLGGVARRVLPTVGSALPELLTRFLRPFVRGPADPEQVRARVETNGREVADRIIRRPSQAEQVRVAFEEVEFRTLVATVAKHSMPLLLAGITAGTVLKRLYSDADDELDALTKGFEDEIATQINQRLGDLADVARQHPAVADALENGASLEELRDVEGGAEFVTAVDGFLDDFGNRASSEMDLSRPRWKDDPATLLRTIRANLEQNTAGDHREHLERLKRNAEKAATELETRAGRGILGPLKRPVVRRLIRVYRGGIQLREHHKHGVMQFLATVHDVCSRAGESLAADGLLDDPEDVWYLRKDELVTALNGETPLDVDVKQRRRTHDRYASMTAPPILTSEGETPTATADTDVSEHTLVGTAVSSGVVEGTARVVHDPSEESLEQGEVLVAPSTDIGWTPLFESAAALVMNVGGRMTHGALVAREYGIPAVVSVTDATAEIETGERIRVDGKRGTVELLDRTESDETNREQE